MNTAIAIVSHPLLLTTDGRRDCILRQEGAPKKQTVPLLDHHDLASEPIGFVELEYTTIATINGENLCFVAGQVNTHLTLERNQAVSMSAPLIREEGVNDILGDIIEVSLVDKASLGGCLVLDMNDLMPVIQSLYLKAPSVVDRLKLELAHSKV
jgi:hypothetical protein